MATTIINNKSVQCSMKFSVREAEGTWGLKINTEKVKISAMLTITVQRAHVNEKSNPQSQ